MLKQKQRDQTLAEHSSLKKIEKPTFISCKSSFYCEQGKEYHSYKAIYKAIYLTMCTKHMCRLEQKYVDEILVVRSDVSSTLSLLNEAFTFHE